MFSKILIANRGEIAVRVIRTARRMGIRTVAVFSEADRNALHVEMADEAVEIGPAPVAESYLRGEAIVAAAQATGAEAIHPGYGFLSENPDFVEAVEAAGLVFIGPSAAAIRAMGLKDAAKRMMEEAGVPVVPGYHGEIQDPDFLASQAEAIGYPVLIKARAGGGGKGMRRVDDPSEFRTALEGAQREAKAAFGDPACLIEKYVEKPRHIEIQVFGDKYGNVAHLGERDCSMQRRHQKVIEEAPAPGMPEAMRQAMGEAAVRAAKAVGYAGAGTVEFIVDASEGLRPDRFWFMEMNTRLQVEHPVTEMITGYDLVELQIHAAAGERYPDLQTDYFLYGHAFEARLYAEDPEKDFLPATGRIAHLRFPAERDGEVRIDAGVREGDLVTPHYDPMIAKLIVHGEDRESALMLLRSALRETRIAGTVTNLAFLSRLAAHEDFARGDVDTGLIARDQAALTQRAEPPAEVLALAALADLDLLSPVPDADPWVSLRGWRAFGTAEQTAHLEHEGERLDLRVAIGGERAFEIAGPSGRIALSVEGEADGDIRFLCEGRSLRLSMAKEEGGITIFSGGCSYRFARASRLEEAHETGSDRLLAPMPGTVKRVTVKAGETVVKGQALIVLEAMKMEHTLKAPRDGAVADLAAVEGDQVENGALLLRLEPEIT